MRPCPAPFDPPTRTLPVDVGLVAVVPEGGKCRVTSTRAVPHHPPGRSDAGELERGWEARSVPTGTRRLRRRPAGGCRSVRRPRRGLRGEQALAEALALTERRLDPGELLRGRRQ